VEITSRIKHAYSIPVALKTNKSGILDSKISGQSQLNLQSRQSRFLGAAKQPIYWPNAPLRLRKKSIVVYMSIEYNKFLFP
jgi:hypothetical protein